MTIFSHRRITETASHATTQVTSSDELSTPFVRIDAEIVQRNIDRLAEYCRTNAIRLRPHTKTHKSQRIAHLQLQAGAVGLTVAKPGEAYVMAQMGAPLLIAYPPITPASLAAIRQLSSEVEILVALDSLEVIRRLEGGLPSQDRQVGVLVDIDLGLHRTGVQTTADSVRLAQQVDRSDRLRLDGIFCYPGHVWEMPNEQREAIQSADSIIQQHLSEWSRHGLHAGIVSGGSTPTAYQSHLTPSVTEIRPGTYVFNDMNTVRGRFCELTDCAVHIVATVVSDAVPNQLVIDAGSKSLAADRCVPAPDAGYGHVLELPQARVTSLSEEHGQVDVSQCSARVRVGDRLTVIPNHVCPTINLTDSAWWLTPDGLERLPIDARGMVR